MPKSTEVAAPPPYTEITRARYNDLRYDALCHKRGLDANKPAPSADIDNWTYYATDTKILYYCDGTQWIAQEMVAAAPSTIEASFTAGEDLPAKAAVYISAANTVKKATQENASKCVGITKEAKNQSESIIVILYGKVTEVVADGAINSGELVTPSASIAGRLVALSTVSGGGSAHSHSLSVNNSVTHSHNQPDTGTCSDEGGFRLPLVSTFEGYCAYESGGNTVGKFQAITTFQDRALPPTSHKHSQGMTNSGGAHNHEGTIGNEAAHTHATQQGKCVGKALSNAAGAGSTFTLLVCLM